MHAEQSSAPMPPPFAPDFLPRAADPPLPSLQRERSWRQRPAAGEGIVASRWCDERTAARHEHAAGPDGRYTLAVALRPARMTLRDANGTVFEGTMPTGTVHVAEPGQAMRASFFSPCDFIHFHVDEDQVDERRDGPGRRRGLRNLLVRDGLAAQLSRTLADDADDGDPRYPASVGQTVLMRVLARRWPAPQVAPRVAPLLKWRLRRVQEHLAANIAEPVRLADLAAAAGLSRMHFAAQFRAATGCRPHDYLLQQRIEHAKHLMATTDTPLVEVALGTGFQTQSHFSAVFKRLAGETPGRWQRARRAG